jgi:hypothetical protein
MISLGGCAPRQGVLPPDVRRLKAAILLGQQMAEQEAISMLAAKVRQALSDDWEHGAEDETIRRLLEQALEK